MHALIIGCGYIGMALARLWRERDYEVTGTTTRQERFAEVASVAAHAALLEPGDREKLAELVADVQVVVVCAAAQSPDLETYRDTYLGLAQTLASVLSEVRGARQIVYTSSTSVYGDHEGAEVDEQTDPQPLTEEAEVLRETDEVYLHSLEHLTATVLRLGEIHGPGRSIRARVTRLAGTTCAGTGASPVNLSHQEDIVAAIDWVVERRLGGLYNVVSPDHPTRAELYEKICRELRLDPVHWDPSSNSRHTGAKQVSSKKLEATGFKFKH